ncbi:PaaI family thioesterase [bacterium]|nr:MAG: PaaI family thioesterase [bacterium]
MMSQWQEIPSYPTCFVCGDKNPIGLKMKFRAKGKMVRAEFIAKPEHCGYQGIVHGGIISAILDEGMGWTGWLQLEKYYLTVELKIRLKKSMRAGEKYHFEGKLVRKLGKIYVAEGTITDTNGELYAEGEGKYYITDF